MPATDLERLILTFEANTSNVEKQLKKLNSTVDKAMNDNGRAANRFGDALDRTASRASAASVRMNKSLAATRFETANVAAQFQDIGVQLAMGQSPFQIAIQQGTQLNQVLGQAGARGALTMLGSAFASLINPISLVTIATIALGGYAVEYFMKVAQGGEKSAKELEKEASNIQAVAKRWGDALPALKAYAEERQKLADMKDLQQATADVVANTWQPVREQIGQINVEMANLIGTIMSANSASPDVDALQKSFADLQSKIKDGTATSQDAKQVQMDLMTLFINSEIPATANLAKQFYALADAIAKASGEAGAFKSQGALKAAQQQLPQLGTLSPVQSGGGKFQNPQEAQQWEASRTRSQTQIAMDKAARHSGGGGHSADQAKKKIDDVIKSLQFEEAQLHRTDLQQEIYNQLKSAGVDINSKAGQQIAALVTQIDQEKQASKEAADAAKFLGDALFQAFDAMIPQINTGNKALDQFLNTLIKAAEQAILLGKGPLAGILGGGGGGLIGGLMSLILPGRASGGPVSSGSPYIVGENGPELFLPGRSGFVVPNSGRMNPSMAAMSPANTNISMPVYINAPGADAAQLRRVEQSVKDLRHSVPKLVDARNKDRQYRGTRA